MHIQNYSIIFVLCSGALHRTETESVIHKADVHIIIFYSLVATKVMDCQLSPFIFTKIKVMKREAYSFTDDRYFKLRLLALHDAGITSFL